MRGWTTKEDGWWFGYATDPTFRCPIGGAERLGDLLEQACEHADIDPAWLLRKLRHSAHRKREENGRLTDRCVTCGHRLERVGFLGRVERPVLPDEQTSGDRISLSIFGGATRSVKTIHLPTKKEIREWAYEEYRTHRASLDQ